MVPNFRRWRSSSGRKGKAQGKQPSYATQAAPQVCLYADPALAVLGVLTRASKQQKGVMISHRNVISNVLQISTFEKPYRDAVQEPGSKYSFTEIALGLLPQSHIYALVVICHATTYRGDQVINLPKFEIGQYLNAIQRFHINVLFLVSR